MIVEKGIVVDGKYKVVDSVDISPDQLVMCEDINNPAITVAYQANYIKNGVCFREE